jgi:hypothetical protein
MEPTTEVLSIFGLEDIAFDYLVAENDALLGIETRLRSTQRNILEAQHWEFGCEVFKCATAQEIVFIHHVTLYYASWTYVL